MKSENRKLQRICYVHMGDFPSDQVHTIQVMRMCEGFQQEGFTPILIGRQNPKFNGGQVRGCSDLFEYYGIEKPFAVRLLQFPFLRESPRPLRVLLLFVYAFYVLIKAKRLNPDLVYVRDHYTAFAGALLKMPLIVEEHAPPLRKSHIWLRQVYLRSSNLLAVVFISNALKGIYKDMGLLSICQSPTIVAHDASALSQIGPSRFEKQSPDKDIKRSVGYVGSLLPGRGIELILELAHALPDFTFRIVGGKIDGFETASATMPVNVIWRGFVPPKDVPREFEEINILLMPYQENTSTHGGVLSSKWMSPLKMFEYMTSNVPLIASDLPVLREVLVSERNCILVPPGDVNSWINAIMRLAQDHDLGNKLAQNAREDVVQTHNWASRAKAIMEMASRRSI